MKTLINSILGLTLGVLAITIFINAEVACAVMVAAGMLAIAMNDYTDRRLVVSGFAA